MAEKVTISRIGRFKNDKDGNPLVNKQGKPFTKVLIDTTDGRTLSGFNNAVTSGWEEGMEVEIEVSEREYNGKTYYNFSTPKQVGGGFSQSDRDMLQAIYNAVVNNKDSDDF